MEDAGDLKAFALGLGFDQAGVTGADPPAHLDAYRRWLEKGYHGEMAYLQRHLPLKAAPDALLPGARSIVALGLNYNQPNPRRPGAPRIARYALGRDYHRVMRGKLRRLAGWIAERHPTSRSRACVDSAPILERELAQRAGLGWFGKNTMLIDTRRGSWFFIGLLLTTVEFERDEPAVGGCGSCRACIDACPTGAIVFEEDRWQVDARACVSYLTIEHPGDHDRDTAGWTFGCDVCQEVCPFNQTRPHQPLRGATTTEPDFLGSRDWPSLSELGTIDDIQWDLLTRGSPVRRAGLEGLRRNARLNLE